MANIYVIYWNKGKRLHNQRVQLPEDFLGTPIWSLLHCFGTPISIMVAQRSSVWSCCILLEKFSPFFPRVNYGVFLGGSNLDDIVYFHMENGIWKFFRTLTFTLQPRPRGPLVFHQG